MMRPSESALPTALWALLFLMMVGIAGAWVVSLARGRPAVAHDGAAARPILHSARCVPVDRRARIRGYDHSGDTGGHARLRWDARDLLRDPRP